MGTVDVWIAVFYLLHGGEMSILDSLLKLPFLRLVLLDLDLELIDIIPELLHPPVSQRCCQVALPFSLEQSVVEISRLALQILKLDLVLLPLHDERLDSVA